MYEFVCVFVYEFQDGEKEPLMPVTKSPAAPKPKVANKQALQTQALYMYIMEFFFIYYYGVCGDR